MYENDKNWHEKYCNIEIVNISKYLNDKDIEVLKKLHIYIEKEKIYTNREFDVIYGELVLYYRNKKEMGEIELEMSKTLRETKVTRKEFSEVLEKFEKIRVEYNFF